MASVIEDADRPLVAALADDPGEFHVEITLAKHQDLLACLVAVGRHPVEVEEVQVRQHRRKRLSEPRDVGVAVVLVVDDAHVGELHRLADGEHILGLPAPAAVVVDGDRAARLGRGLRRRPKRGGGVLHLRLLVEVPGGVDHHPERWLQRPLLEARQQTGEIGWLRPEGVECDAVLRQCLPLPVERGHVLGPPVVGEVLEAECREHRRPLLGAAFFPVVGHEAPGDQVVAAKELLGPRGDVGSLLLDDQDPVHQLPVPWERAQEGIPAGRVRDREIDRLPPAGLGNVGVGDHVVGLGDVMPGHRLRIGDQPVGQRAHGGQRAGLRQHPVVRHHVGIREREGESLAGLGPHLRRLVGQVRGGLDRDGPRILELRPPRVLDGRLQHRQVAEDRMGRDRPGRLLVARDVAERLGEGMDRGEHVPGLAAADGHVQVQLVHGLDVGELEKQALAVGEHGGRADRQRIVAHRAVVAG